MKVIETLRRPHMRGTPVVRTSSGANQIAGITTLASGSASVTVSTTAVKSDSLVLFGIVGNTNQSSGVAKPVEVRSLTDSNWFAFAYADGTTVARDVTIRWLLVDTAG